MSNELKTLDQVLNSFQLHLKAKKGQYNNFGKYKYRTAEDILAAFKEEAKKSNYPDNCILLTNIELKEILNRLFVCVTATLRVGKDEVKSEGFAEHAINKKGMDEAQLTGATITYARKYALQNLFGIDESEDDLDNDKNNNQNNIINELDEDMIQVVYEWLQNALNSCQNNQDLDKLIDDKKFKQSLSKLTRLNQKMANEIKELGKSTRNKLTSAKTAQADVTQPIPSKDELENPELTEEEKAEILRQEQEEANN